LVQYHRQPMMTKEVHENKKDIFDYELLKYRD